MDERGLTTAIKRGINESKGDIVMWLDCDFSHPPKIAPLLVNPLFDDKKDIVIASRFIKGGGMEYSFTRTLVSKALNKFAEFLLYEDITDYTSGYVATRKSVFDKVNLKGDYGEYFINFIDDSKKNGFIT